MPIVGLTFDADDKAIAPAVLTVPRAMAPELTLTVSAPVPVTSPALTSPPFVSVSDKPALRTVEPHEIAAPDLWACQKKCTQTQNTNTNTKHKTQNTNPKPQTPNHKPQNTDPKPKTQNPKTQTRAGAGIHTRTRAADNQVLRNMTISGKHQASRPEHRQTGRADTHNGEQLT